MQPQSTPEPFVGRVAVHPRGFGFVTAEDGRSAFIVPPDLNAFLADDRVSCTVEAEGDRLTARGLALVERPRTRLFGEVVRRGKRPFLRVDRLVSNTDWPLTGEAPAGAAVLASILPPGEGGGARLLRVVVGDEAEILRLLCRHDLAAEHAPELLAAAESAPQAELSGRRDLRGQITVTVDGPDTRDIDDALLALPPDADGALRIVVAIADVGSAVVEGSVLDADARARATSVYLPGRVLPMLPPQLSEERLSLLEGHDRPALTVELRIDTEGEIRSVDVNEAIIRSTARLTYDAVTAFFEGGPGAAAVPEAVHDTLRHLRAAAARLSQSRAARGGKDVEREEISVRLDEQGAPVGLSARRSDVAHVMVERLMVAANEAVARFLLERGLPGVYRVHPAPTAERTQALAEAAAALGVVAGFSRTAPLTPRALAAFDRQIRGTRDEEAVESAMRRLLGPARYSPEPAPHFGLAAPLYLHFTSPIRRYADLCVHRLLRRYLRGERGDFGAAAAELPALCAHIDDRGRRAARAESERARVLVARLYERRIGERLRAVVLGHKPQGALVQIEGALALLPGETPPLGTPMEVVVAAVDVELGRIDVRRP